MLDRHRPTTSCSPPPRACRCTCWGRVCRRRRCASRHGDDLAEGDAFIHNDPYLGNTHTADVTILVPVFYEGEHVFTACAKAHQADIGNAEPSTYMAYARDLYAEGGLNFPVRPHPERL